MRVQTRARAQAHMLSCSYTLTHTYAHSSLSTEGLLKETDRLGKCSRTSEEASIDDRRTAEDFSRPWLELYVCMSVCVSCISCLYVGVHVGLYAYVCLVCLSICFALCLLSWSESYPIVVQSCILLSVSLFFPYLLYICLLLGLLLLALYLLSSRANAKQWRPLLNAYYICYY